MHWLSTFSIVAIAAGSSALGAQATVRLTTPDEVLSDAFSFVRGVRELANGQLLVADWVEQRVVLVDLAAGSTRDVITEGAGPQNVRLPMGLVPYRGDSTLLLDYGNNRISILAPSGRAARSIRAEAPGRGGVRASDASGAFYFAFPAWAERGQELPDDSVRVMRWTAGDDVLRGVTVVQGTRMRKDRSPALLPRIPTVGYAPQDAWSVTEKGTIVVVRGAPYRVEFIEPSGAVRLGPAQATDSRPVTMADKRRYVREFNAGTTVSGRGENGGMGRPPAVDAAEVDRFVSTMEWASVHPAFDPSRVHLAPDGRVWVGRPAVPGQLVHYDVFDERGIRVQEVQLRADRRVAFVGMRGVYVVADNSDGVQSIERYRTP